MRLSYAELNKGNLFLSNRNGIEIKDVFKNINEIYEEQELYRYLSENIYLTEEDRHYKLGISKYMNDTYLHADKSINEEIDVIIDKLKSVIEHVEESIESTEKWRLSRISKLIEHIGLEQLRISEQNRYYESNLEKSKKIDERICQIDEKSNEVIQKLDSHKNEISKKIDEKVNNIENELDNSKKSIYKEILSIVGIFTAISFGAFGGISVLNSLFGNAGSDGIKITDMIILGCISSICILTLLYIFIVYLSRMTGLSISVDGSKEKFFRDNKVLICSYAFLLIILITTFIVTVVNSNKETWDLFIEYINLWLKNKIIAIDKIPS